MFQKNLKHTAETKKKISEALKFNYALKSLYKKKNKEEIL